jgi:hypothetical protein
MGNPYQDTAIEHVFLAFCADHGLTVMTQGIDKHGSIVWEAGERRELTRYIFLSGTEILDGEQRVMQMEISIGADDGFHFTHGEHGSWTLSREEFMSVGHSVYGAATAPRNGHPPINTIDMSVALYGRLVDAWQAAQALRPDDLHDTYIVPRNEQWQDTAVR